MSDESMIPLRDLRVGDQIVNRYGTHTVCAFTKGDGDAPDWVLVAKGGVYDHIVGPIPRVWWVPKNRLGQSISRFLIPLPTWFIAFLMLTHSGCAQIVGTGAPPVAIAPMPVPAIPQETSLTFLLPKINATVLLEPLDEMFPKFRTFSGWTKLSCVVAAKGSNAIAAPPGLLVRYLVDDVVVAGPAPWSETVDWDTGGVDDGTHVIAVDPVDCMSGGENLQARCIAFAVENGAAPDWTTARSIPVCNPGFRQLIPSQRPSMAPWRGRMPWAPTIRRLDPSGPLVPATDLRNPTAWYAEDLLGSGTNGLYRGDLQWALSRDGNVSAQIMYARGSSNSEDQVGANARQPWFCGPRPNGTVSPYSTFVAHPLGIPGFVGIDINGRVVVLEADGDTRTLFGAVNRRRWGDVATSPPLWWGDASFTALERAPDHEFIGVVAAGQPAISVANDLAFRPGEPDVVYVADTQNHRIAAVDLRGTPQAFVAKGTGIPRLSTFLGGSAGYQDGPGDAARFNRPTSLAWTSDGSALYVADRNNCAVRVYGHSSASVSTVAGGALATTAKPTEALTNPSVYPPNQPGQNAAQTRGDWILYPQALRLASNGDVVVAENLTHAIKVIVLGSDRVDVVRTRILESSSAASNPWTWLEVDSGGLIGPKDDILTPLIGGLGNGYIGRTSRDGTFLGTLLSGKGDRNDGPADRVPPDWQRHYPWAVAIGADGTILTTGMGSQGPGLLRRRRADDQSAGQSGPWQNGRAISRLGTVQPFGMNVRPSFGHLHGIEWASRLGGWTADQVATVWLDVQSLQSVQEAYDLYLGFLAEGFGDWRPRPEITGQDAWDLAHFVLNTSIHRGWTLPPRPVSTGLGPVISTASISRVGSIATISWTTTVPTIGLARYGGPSGPLGRAWDLTDQWGNAHSQTIQDVPARQLTWYVVARDHFGRAACVRFDG